MAILNNLLSDVYEINVVFDIPKYKTNDISTLYIYRCPLVKSASFAILNINLPIIEYLQLENELRQNKHPKIEFDLFIADRSEKDPKNFRIHKKIKKLISKKYIILFSQSLEPLNTKNETPLVSLYLVNDIFFYLNNNNGYNKILENITGLEAVQDFENFLAQTFGTTAFTFLKIGEKKFINKFKYEQILTRTHDDLQIPTFLIRTYKVFNTFSYYFFDDFAISKNSQTDITNYLINLGDKKSFNKINVLNKEYADLHLGNALKKVYPLYDIFDNLAKINPTLILEGKEFNFDNKKATGTTQVPQLKSSSQTDQIQQQRPINITKSNISLKSNKITEYLNLYAPDELKVAKERFDTISEQLRKNFQAIYVFEMLNSHPDILQFNNIYNLDQNNTGDFNFVPLSIINIFRRESQQTFLKHSTQYQCLKYIDE